MNRQKGPEALHLIVTPNHECVAEEFLRDLEAAWEAVRNRPGEGSETRIPMLYGGTAGSGGDADARERAFTDLEGRYAV